MAAQQPAGHAAPPMQAVIMPRPVKVHLPDLFDGSRQQLSSFFGQLALYFGFHTDQFPVDQPEKKILFATTLMRGSAYECFEGYLDDYLESPNDETQRENANARETIYEGLGQGHNHELKDLTTDFNLRSSTPHNDTRHCRSKRRSEGTKTNYAYTVGSQDTLREIEGARDKPIKPKQSRK